MKTKMTLRVSALTINERMKFPLILVISKFVGISLPIYQLWTIGPKTSLFPWLMHPYSIAINSDGAQELQSELRCFQHAHQFVDEQKLG